MQIFFAFKAEIVYETAIKTDFGTLKAVHRRLQYQEKSTKKVGFIFW